MMPTDDAARAAHPHSAPQTHAWGPPAPGSGSMDICTKCGAKRTGDADRAGHPANTCGGIQPVAHQTQSEYDPV